MPLANLAFDPGRPQSIETLQVVFKVVERCNLNCSYCYYFNMGDTSALERPAVVSLETARSLGRWIAEGCRELQIPKVSIAFHGGETMLLKPRNFAAICETLRDQIAPVAALSFCIQTNGTILNDEWLEIFREYAVRVGISIDGERRAHDRYRLNVQGRSTFDRTEDNLKHIAQWARGDPRLMPSTITVIDPDNDYTRIYEYLRGLGVEQMNFLLPDRNADDPPPGGQDSSRSYGKVLYEIFEAWLAEDNPNVHIKYVDRMMAHFQLVRPRGRDSKRNKKEYQVIMARSDATVAINDSYTPALSWYKQTPVYSIFGHSLREFLSDEIFLEIEDIASTVPAGCASCKWKRICKGGDLENRFSSKNGFDNPSVYCEGYKLLYQGVCDLLIENGYPVEAMRARFGDGDR